MSTAIAERISPEQGYEICRSKIKSMAYRYQLFFGDQAAAEAEAYLIFREHLPDYDESRPLPEWIGSRIYYRFQNIVNNHRGRQLIAAINYKPDMLRYPCSGEFDQQGFLEVLSPDARFLSLLVLDPPPDFAEVFEFNQKLLTLRLYVSRQGWPRQRITDAIQEIRKALT